MDKITPNFEKRGGFLPVVAQDLITSEVLMLGYANREAYEGTLETGLATYWSTSRDELWIKGETSGDTQLVKEILIDCDNDALIYKVIQQGKGACHAGKKTCFYRKI